jgi:hypothetical protein
VTFAHPEKSAAGMSRWVSGVYQIQPAFPQELPPMKVAARAKAHVEDRRAVATLRAPQSCRMEKAPTHSPSPAYRENPGNYFSMGAL